MSERDRKGSRDGGGGGGEGAQEGPWGGTLGWLVEQFGAAGAQRIVQRRLAQRRAREAAAGGAAAEQAAGEAGAAAEPGAESAPRVQEAADQALRGPGGPLPHRDAIARSFGRHDVSHVQAHTDERARAGAAAMGADAFASGDHVAFAGEPDLHTAAHEAAHVVQQRGGVQLKGGVGAAGDAYEENADAVAHQVVKGQSAEALLDAHAGTGAGGAAAVQMKPVTPAPAATVDGDTKQVNSDRGDQSKFAHLSGKVGGFRKVYKAGGHEAVVFLPAAGIQSPVDIMVFFHGHFADYSVDKTGNFSKSGDNPAQGMAMAEAVTKSGRNVIGILASAEQHARFTWDAVGVNLHEIVHGVLQGLSTDLGVKDLKAGDIALAGHSAGGDALGLATDSAGRADKPRDAQDDFGADNVHEVTLEEAGYNFDSLGKLSKWFLTGKAPKKIRIITVASHKEFQDAPGKLQAAQAAADAAQATFNQDSSPGNQKALELAQKKLASAKGDRDTVKTRNAFESGGHLSLDHIKRDLKTLKLTKLTAAQGAGEKKARSDGLLLEFSVDVSGDGERKIEIFRDTSHNHFGVRNHVTAELLDKSL